MQNCWRHVFCVFPKKNKDGNLIWQTVGDALTTTCGLNSKSSSHCFPCVQIWKIHYYFLFNNNRFRSKALLSANLGWIGCENWILDYGGYGKWSVPLAHPCRTTCKIGVRKGSVTNVPNLFCILLIECQQRWRWAQSCCSYMFMLMCTHGKCNTCGDYMLK